MVQLNQLLAIPFTSSCLSSLPPLTLIDAVHSFDLSPPTCSLLVDWITQFGHESSVSFQHPHQLGHFWSCVFRLCLSSFVFPLSSWRVNWPMHECNWCIHSFTSLIAPRTGPPNRKQGASFPRHLYQMSHVSFSSPVHTDFLGQNGPH